MIEDTAVLISRSLQRDDTAHAMAHSVSPDKASLTGEALEHLKTVEAPQEIH